MSWQKIKIKDIAKIDWGNTSITKASYVEEGFDAYSATGRDGFLPFAENKNDGIVLSAIGARCGKCFIARGEWTAIKNTITIFPNTNLVDLNFLFILLNDEKSWHIKGAGQPFITKGAVSDRIISLPPLDEQKRIAAILDKANEIKAKRELALAKLDELADNTFIELFEVGSTYEQAKLSDVCELITDGTHYTPTYADDGVVFLSAKNVTSGKIDWNNIKHIPQSLHLELQKRVQPKYGDVLLAKNGTTGVAAIVDKDVVFDIYVSLALLRPSKKLLSAFLHGALNSSITKRQFNSSLKGIGVPNLHLVDIRKTTIPLPSIKEQEQFIKIMRDINKNKEMNLSFLNKQAEVISSLQNQAFTNGFNA